MAGPRCQRRAHELFSSCRQSLTSQSRRDCGPDHFDCTTLESDQRRAQHRPACLECKNVVSQRGQFTYTKRPGRRKCSPSTVSVPSIFSAHATVLFIICLLYTGVLAESRLAAEDYSRINGQRRSLGSSPARSLDDLADHSKPLRRRSLRMRFEPRQDDASSTSPESTITIPAFSTTSESSQSERRTTTTVTATSSQDATATVLAASALPKPFDTSLGNNFTSTCLPFIDGMLDDEGFQECVPFSLLLQNSQGFFQAEKSLVSVTQVLDASCSANFDHCNDLMSGYAVQLKASGNCGTDLSQNNPTIAQAYDGLVSYQTMYAAGCLKDDSGSYCFADAVTNSSSISDSYPYYLPLNMAMPGGAQPTCNDCLQKTMQGFANAATNGSQPVSNTYQNAAQQINIACGPNFVDTNVAVRSGSAASATIFGGMATPMVALAALLFHALS